MASKEELMVWRDAQEEFDCGNYQQALVLYESIADYCKVLFNIAMIYIRMEQYDEAIGMFSRALLSDPYLAVAYFQRGYCQFLVEDYESAHADYSLAIELLLENNSIEYTQLDMKYSLHRCEVLYNRAMCKQIVGNFDKAEVDIVDAQKYVETENQRNIIGTAARMGVVDVTLFAVPINIVFTISESKLKNLDRKQHIKKAKVIIGKPGHKSYVGFTGAALLSATSPVSLNFNCADEIPSPPSSPIPSNQRIKQQQQQQKASHPPTPPPHGRNHPTLRRLNTTRINNTISIKNSPNSLSPYTTASPSTLSSTADAFEAITLHSGVGSTGILARKSSISSSRYHPPQSPGYRNNTSRSQFPTTGPISAPSSAAALATPQFWNMKSSPDGLDDQQLPPLLNRSYSTNSTSSRYNNNSKDNYQQQQQSHHQRSHTMRYMHKTSDSSSSSSSGASSADDSELESPQLLRSLTNASSKHRFKVHCPKTDAIIALFMDQDNLQLTHLVTKVREKLRLDYLPSLNYRDGVDPTPISLVDTEDLLASLENGGGHLFVSAASAGGNGTQLDLGKLSSWKMMKPSASPPLPPPASHSYDIFDSYN